MKLIAAATALALLAVPAQAESLLLGAPMASSDSGFHWDGLYVGVGGGAEIWTMPGYTEHKVDGYAYVGGNVTAGNFLFGAEAFLNGYYAFEPNATSLRIGATARAGYLVTPDIVLYGEAGGFNDFNFAPQPITGLGAEFAVSDNVSVDLTYDYVWSKSPTVRGHQLSASALWHF